MLIILKLNTLNKKLFIHYPYFPQDNKSILELLNKIYSFNVSPKVHVLLSPISVVNDFRSKIVSYYKKYVL